VVTAEVPRSGATAADPALLSRQGAVTATLAAVVLLVAAAALVATPSGSGDDQPLARAAPSVARATSTSPTPTAETPEPDPAVGDPGVGALAFESVPLGRDGMAAGATFEGLVLEQRAVGLTVTYPSVSVTTDGRRSLAHVRLPTFNCLTAEPPADPVAAGCARSLTEYADLADPQLQVTRDGDRIELAGLFPTYTRPTGSAPTPTGRAYPLSASIGADGAGGRGGAPATGVVRIGLDSAATTDGAGNLVQLPG
jgi:hypothetical protein